MKILLPTELLDLFHRCACVIVGAGLLSFSLLIGYGLLYHAPVESLGLRGLILINLGLLIALIGIGVSLILFVLARSLRRMGP